MGRTTKATGSIANHPSLFAEGELPESSPKLPDKDFKSLRFPLWTQNKARLIQEYLRLFVYITKHGTYIDGFAAPQTSDHEGMWSAKLVLEMEPKWFRRFWLCDIAPDGIAKLNRLKAERESRKRAVEVLEGDFNQRVREILRSGKITEKTATFALLDQRTFECEWGTVVALSEHKQQNKIEIFYFFATGWIDRSLGALRAPETIAKVQRWWGNPDWGQLRGVDGTIRARMVARRFETELGYGKATVYPIHNQRRNGRVMYHMIHATDHAEATPLMIRAYRRISGRSELPEERERDFDELWRRIESDTD